MRLEQRLPSHASMMTEDSEIGMHRDSDVHWSAADVNVFLAQGPSGLTVRINATKTAVCRIRLRWEEALPGKGMVLGGSFERAYGDLAWSPIDRSGRMFWYFLLHDKGGTSAAGVLTGGSAICSWEASSKGVHLDLDIRNGAMGVLLDGRTLHAATIVGSEYGSEVTTHQAARQFCRSLASGRHTVAPPVCISNPWYYAYGRSTSSSILDDARLLSTLAPATPHRPYLTVDAGWQLGADRGDVNIGTWTRGNEKFPDMPGLATRMLAAGVRPGLWSRSLVAPPGTPESLLLPRHRAVSAVSRVPILDPSLDDVLADVHHNFSRFRSWGFEMFKHDFSTSDVLGRMGHAMAKDITSPHWHFADRSRTTAEILRRLYSTIRAATPGTVVLGCNTVGHLAAGLEDQHRAGDDTSGHNLTRARVMLVNTVAFRGYEHDTFYGVDPDAVAVQSDHLPWRAVSNLLDLASRSGLTLTIAVDPSSMDEKKMRAFRRALEAHATTTELAEPLDWLERALPRRWQMQDATREFEWGPAKRLEHSPVLPELPFP